MAVRTKEEILQMIRERIGESTDDDTIHFVEDVSDTLDDYDSRTGTAAEWEQRYRDNDAEWRKRYTDRFFSAPPAGDKNINPYQDTAASPDPDPEDPSDHEAPKTYEDLFKTEETEVR